MLCSNKEQCYCLMKLCALVPEMELFRKKQLVSLPTKRTKTNYINTYLYGSGGQITIKFD